MRNKRQTTRAAKSEQCHKDNNNDILGRIHPVSRKMSLPCWNQMKGGDIFWKKEKTFHESVKSKSISHDYLLMKPIGLI